LCSVGRYSVEGSSVCGDCQAAAGGFGAVTSGEEDHTWVLQDTCGAYGCDVPPPSPTSKSVRAVLTISISRPSDEAAFKITLIALFAKHAGVVADRIVIISITIKVSKVEPTLFALSTVVTFEVKPPAANAPDQTSAQAYLYNIAQAVNDPQSPLRRDGAIGQAMTTINQVNADGTVTPVKPAPGQSSSAIAVLPSIFAALLSILAILFA